MKTLIVAAALALGTLVVVSAPAAQAQRRGGAHYGYRGGHYGGYRGGYSAGYRGWGGYRGGYSTGYRGWGGYYPSYGYSSYPYSGYSSYPYSGYSSYPDSDLSATAPVIPPSSDIPDVPAASDAAAAGVAAADSRAHLTVRVPDDAEVWLGGAKTTSTGPVREYASPPLNPGKRYFYEVRTRWSEGGQEVTQTQSVPVTAGAHVDVNFPMGPAATEQR